MSDNINAKRIARNTILLYVRMLLIMVVTIYMARVVLKVLGVEDYGVYDLVSGIVAFLGFLNSAMSMATQRFLNVELGKTDRGNLRTVFNMTLNIHAIIGAVIVIFAETVGLWLVNTKLNIPVERMYAANWAYQCVVATAFFGILQVPYNSAIFAYEKMDVYAYLSIFDVFLKLGLTFLVTLINADKLILYSLLMLGVHILVFFIYSFYVSRKFESCRVRLIWDKEIFKSISGFLGWNVCGQISQILTTQGVNMIANVFYGVILNAAIALTNQVNGAISMFVNNFQTSFRPQIMKSYAAGQLAEMKKLVYKSSKVSFFLLYAISLPIMLNIDFILVIWLETVPEYTAIFCKLLIWYTYMEAMGMPLVIAIMATGQNKYYQIFVSLAISLNLLLCWILLSSGFSPVIIFCVKIALSFLVITVRMFFARRQAQISIREFALHALRPAVKVCLLVQPIYYLIYDYTASASVLPKIVLTALISLFMLNVIWWIGLTYGERQFLSSIVINKTKRK